MPKANCLAIKAWALSIKIYGGRGSNLASPILDHGMLMRAPHGLRAVDATCVARGVAPVCGELPNSAEAACFAERRFLFIGTAM
jgi:hypothetical protein